MENSLTMDDGQMEMTIDIEKMKALAAKIHAEEWKTPDMHQAATAIDTLLYELEAREADRRDAIRFRDLLDAVTREVQRGAYDRPYRGIENAPGHCHAVTGIWDPDNGAKSGTQCAWCATWNAARSALAQRQEGEEK